MFLEFEDQKISPEHVVLRDIGNFVMLVQHKKINYEVFILRFTKLYVDFKYVEDENLEYSADINIFKIVCLIVDECIGYQEIGVLYKLHQRKLNDIMDVFHKYSYLQKKEKLNQLEQSLSNRKSLLLYIDLLFQHYSRLLIVRVDLNYFGPYSFECDIKQFNLDIKRYRKYIGKRRKCFAGLQGYAWALEQGESRGYHCHLMLVYDGSLHNNGWDRASEAGKFWKEITEQRGGFFNCHDPKYLKKFQQIGTCGLGIVHRHDKSMQDNAKALAVYLTKNEQHLLVKLPSMRTFGTGQFDIKSRRGVQKTLQVVGKLNSS